MFYFFPSFCFSFLLSVFPWTRAHVPVVILEVWVYTTDLFLQNKGRRRWRRRRRWGHARVFFVSSLRLGQSTNPPTLKDALSSLFRSFFCTPTLTPTPTHSLTHSHSQSTNYTVLSYVSLRTFLSFSSLYNMCIIIANASLFPFPPSFFLSLSHSRHLTHSRSLTLVVPSLLLSSSSLLGSTPA